MLTSSKLDPATISSWLMPEEILLDCNVLDRRHAVRDAAKAIAQRHHRDADPIERALWRREQIGTTGIGEGVAIPHARIGGIDRPLTLFMRPRWAIDFAAPDGKPVHDLLVIVVPTEGDPDHHLQLLAAVAEMFSDFAFRSRLAGATDTDSVRRAFADWSHRMTCRGDSTS